MTSATRDQSVPVVGDPVLHVVVGADLLVAGAASRLDAALRRRLVLLPLQLRREQPATEGAV